MRNSPINRFHDINFFEKIFFIITYFIRSEIGNKIYMQTYRLTKLYMHTYTYNHPDPHTY